MISSVLATSRPITISATITSRTTQKRQGGVDAGVRHPDAEGDYGRVA